MERIIAQFDACIRLGYGGTDTIGYIPIKRAQEQRSRINLLTQRIVPQGLAPGMESYQAAIVEVQLLVVVILMKKGAVESKLEIRTEGPGRESPRNPRFEAPVWRCRCSGAVRGDETITALHCCIVK